MVTPGNSLPNGQPNNVHHDGVSTPNLLNHCIDEGRHIHIVISEQIHTGLAAADYNPRIIQLVLDFLAF